MNEEYIRNLLSCRQAHLDAIALLDQLLANAGQTNLPHPPLPPEVNLPGRFATGVGRRARSGTSKRRLIEEILRQANRPLRLHEILEEMINRKYPFTSTYPKSTLNPFFYGAARLPFVSRTREGFVLKGRGREFGLEEMDSNAAQKG